MKLIYLYHSGFSLQNEQFTMVIDFFSGNQIKTANTINQIIQKKVLNRNVQLYVLSTHYHKDHFDPKILHWEQYNQENGNEAGQSKPPIYIFSEDVFDSKQTVKIDAHFLDVGETYEDFLVKVQAFGSTDAGVSFYIEAGGKRIFHAGDLNNWHWNEEVPAEEAWEYQNAYLTELERISKHIDSLDLLMFPIDPRLGKDYMLGASQFLDKIKVSLFAPMHFGSQYNMAAAFESIAKAKGTNFVKWTKKGESIEF